MALVKATIETLVKSKMDAEFGTAVGGFSGERDKFASVMADVLIDVLLTQFDITGSTTIVSGSSAGAYPATIVKA